MLAPEKTGVNGAITNVLKNEGGVDPVNMWGAPQFGRWQWHSPNTHVVRLVDQNTRLWVYSPAAGSPSDGGAVGAFPDIWQSTSRDFYADYRSAGGHNGHFDLGAGGGNDWGTWSQQLGALSGDLVSNIR
jgi:S-formylglutathione hydrolase FrmB